MYIFIYTYIYVHTHTHRQTDCSAADTMTVSFSRESFLPEWTHSAICIGRTRAALWEKGTGHAPPCVQWRVFHGEAPAEKLFHALCLPPVAVAERVEVRGCDAVARPCKNKWKTLQSNNNNNNKSWSLVFIWICEEFFFFCLTSMNQKWLRLVFNHNHELKASFGPTVVGSVLNHVNHCAVIRAESFLPCSSPSPPPLSLAFFQGWGGGWSCFSVSGCFDSCKEKCISDTVHRSYFLTQYVCIVNKNVISWYRYLISFLSK